ncbi:ras guanine nucleotide exchange factor domain-containing protein [Polychytrium aggregatum]|uniref:ras guanine nucleotide exchange factor domain-containing protein n=1 Tax=Polychytrium aggregatum TaxID=110093 RepID=UPI0022FEFDA0|nr:ras guanine nucleotide exchange factor domain-containing protein [Polychytrium aggregatum]KAI9202628.1 ras guanine nucleotide exchange factor domain-containing protein [Polychytrium aggregatum]
MDLSPILGQIPNEVPRPLAIQRAPKFSTWQFRPEDLAAQITLIEHRNFTSIKMHEFHHQAWTSKLKTKLAPNLVNFIDFFNRIAYGVASELVSEPKIKTRVTLLKRWIFVAHQCLKLRNYNTVFEIVAGLNMGCVSRLKKTWKALSKKYWDVWEMLNHVVSNEGSYRWYRSQIAEVVRSNSTGGIPCVPYLGVNLSDLTFAEDGNPTFAKPSVALEAEPLAKVAGAAPPPTPIVNFNKFRFISQLINKIEFMQRYEYTLPPDPKIQDFILHEWGNLTEAELYTASKVCEPRIAGT